MKRMKKWMGVCLSMVLLALIAPAAPAPASASEDYQIADYYKDQNVISDGELFGAWDEETGKWLTEPKLSYAGFPALSGVEQAAKAGDYDAAKEAYRAYHRKKYASYDKTMYGDGSAKQYAQFAMAKNNIVMPSSDFQPITLVTAPEDWGYVEIDYTAGLAAARNASDKTEPSC